MNSRLIAFVFIVLFFVQVSLALKCGFVSHSGSDELLVQSSKRHISVSWAGFEEEHKRDLETISYEWAIISDSLVDNSLQKEVRETKNCVADQGFEGKPDVLNWTPATGNFASHSTLKLSPGETYYALVKATSSDGTVLITRSAGVRVTRADNNVILKYLSFLTTTSDDSSSSSSDDDLEPYQAGLIAMGVVLFVLLLLAIIITAILLSRGEDKYQTNVHRNENVEAL